MLITDADSARATAVASGMANPWTRYSHKFSPTNAAITAKLSSSPHARRQH